MIEGRRLEVIGSAGCNLKCSYCYLHKNPSYFEEDKLVVKAMKDGTFLKNIKTVLKYLKVYPEEFETFTIWGGETAAHLSECKEFFASIFQTFPKIKKVSYSTNFTVNIQNHLDFIEVMEKYCQQNEIHFEMQISIDGPTPINKITRGYDFEDCHKKTKELIEKLNQIKLKKVHVGISYKATLPWVIYRQICSSIESIEEYLSFWKNESDYFNDLIINGNVSFSVGSCYGPSFKAPYRYTVQDGIEMANFSNMIFCHHLDEKFDALVNMPLLSCGLVIPEDENVYNFNSGCGEMATTFTFSWDGRLNPCSNGFMDFDDTNVEWLKNNDPKEYKRVLKSRPLSIMANKDRSLDLEAIAEKHQKALDFWPTQGMFIKTVLNSQLYELACAGQVSPIYKEDHFLRYRHAVLIYRKVACSFNAKRETGSVHVPLADFFKLSCNGLSELYELRRYGK